MKEYDHKKIEKKWQGVWDKKKIYNTKNTKGKKFYGLIEFPYPSGAGLHVGHIRSNTAMDIISRKRRMEGCNVLYPIGWDAFGLPTENYAIKTGIQPAIVTKQNTDTFRRQLKELGFSFDWSREVDTTDPAYYKWTQWIFLQMYKKGLAYKAKTEINWCPKDKIGLANEEAEGGVCDRCGGPVEKRDKEQWMLAITKYADRLDKDLDGVDYLEKIKIQQRNWIGKSEGALIKFESEVESIEVFTTRPDTIYGVTFIAISGKADRFTGRYVTNPANKEKIPVWEAEYVLSDYGTGAIMGVPAHDERDFEFAKRNNLPVVDKPFVDIKEVIKLTNAKVVTKFKLRDWVFSRQRYWGEPIPIIHCDVCGYVPVPEKDLPIKLPKVKSYQPTDNGESPLATISKWVNTKCPKCKGKAKRETDTMPNWAGSSWYYLRYTDPKNKKEFASKKALKYWMGNGVDWYNGGMEHTTLHLLYSRFWHKFLYDLKLVPTKEPYMKRTSHGMILAEDGVKMSKSLGNTVDPKDVVKNFGADTLRVYEMFMGPFDQSVNWSTDSIVGPRRFLERVWKLKYKIGKNKSSKELEKVLHKTIKKVGEDIEEMRFNTAVSSMMILAGEMEKSEIVAIGDYKKFLQILAPFAPHITEELWSELGEKKSIHISTWLKYDQRLIIDSEIKIVVQVNGKLKGEIMINNTATEDEVRILALANESVIKSIASAEIKKIVYVKGRLINIVI